MDDFFRDYLTVKESRIPWMCSVYDTFKIFRHDNVDGFASAQEFCRDLLKYARFYTDLVYAKSEDPEIQSLYRDAKEMRMDVAYPFLLRARNYWDSNLISRDDYVEILKICITYVLRRNICSIPTNSLNKTFATTLPNFLRKDDIMDSIRAFFVLSESYKRMPNNEELKREFMSHDMYHMHVRSYVFRRLEDYNNKAPIAINNYSIEHIMPQNENLSPEWIADLGPNWKEVQEKYLHTIGNLALTAHNSEMSDKSFMYKMSIEGGFKQSALRLNSYVVQQTSWNEEKIKERAEQLASLALKIWEYPKISDDVLVRYKTSKKKAEEYTILNYNPTDHSRLLYEQLSRQILNISADVTQEFEKTYVAYKLDTNFVDVVFHNDYLQLFINLNFDEVDDPQSQVPRRYRNWS